MVTVHIEDGTAQAKALLELLETFPFVKIENTLEDGQPRYNAETEQAIEDARAGKNMIQAENARDLLRKLKEDV